MTHEYDSVFKHLSIGPRICRQKLRQISSWVRKAPTQPAIKLTRETLEQGKKYVES